MLLKSLALPRGYEGANKKCPQNLNNLSALPERLIPPTYPTVKASNQPTHRREHSLRAAASSHLYIELWLLLLGFCRHFNRTNGSRCWPLVRTAIR